MNMTTHVAVKCCVVLRGITAACRAPTGCPSAEKCPKAGGAASAGGRPAPLRTHRDSIKFAHLCLMIESAPKGYHQQKIPENHEVILPDTLACSLGQNGGYCRGRVNTPDVMLCNGSPKLEDKDVRPLINLQSGHPVVTGEISCFEYTNIQIGDILM